MVGQIIGDAIVLAFFAILLFGGLLFRRRRKVEDPRPGYLDIRPPQPVGRAMNEFASTMRWGSGTVTEWRRRCELSLERSRARRG